MRSIREALGWIFTLALAAIVVWALGLSSIVRESVAAGHLLDWVMGAVSLAWLVVVLKVPWDLFFEAQAVTFELQRAAERQIELPAGRVDYVRRLRQRLLGVALGAHLFSAAVIAAMTYFSGGAVGYYFATFYLLSTGFRPAVAGYVYLSGKLRAIGEETRYPRNDVVALEALVQHHEEALRSLRMQIEQLGDALTQESDHRARDSRELRHSVQALARELETTVSRLTDNQDLIRGIQAFVRLVGQTGRVGET